MKRKRTPLDETPPKVSFDTLTNVIEDYSIDEVTPAPPPLEQQRTIYTDNYPIT